ncbi:fatty-acid--CoA ligase [Amycolatopsis antarctica]|uniref:Fatty-acid--CoA ligase n=1 Tax=Amycolatopsis antarctica TaxID=1854586 RepID=A0A263CYL1_9PSEU|nr:fatty acid--CoA ligase family protein [Amycolatopsis antarctica]OZM71250.1 fatty-acid--CoA ligase [Amycolatopsis antarctica]
MPVPAPLVDLAPGARVVIRMPGGEGLAAVLRHCFDRELVAVPLGPRTADAELAALVRSVRASAIVDGPGAEFRGTGHLPAEDDPTGLAFIMFTSGSTGPQKGVMLSRAAVLGNATKTARLHGIGPDRPHGTCLPLHHCNALVMSLLGTHRTGAPLVLRERFDPAGYFAALRTAGARTASIVPALLPELLDAAPEWPEGLDYLITAAAPLTSELASRFHRAYGPRLRQGYGLTEAVNFSFTMPALDGRDYAEQYLDRFPPVGLPLDGTEFRLDSGEVQIRTADLMDGYWEDPGTTAAAMTPDGWLRTGDLGELRDGLLMLKGRTRERIDRGGEKYYPLDLERRWRAAGLSGRFAAVGVTEPDLGQEIALIVTDQPVDRVRTVCEHGEPRPAVVQFGGLLATATGKPQRTAMGRRLASRRQSATRYENLLRYAARTARSVLRETHQPPGNAVELARALAACPQGHADSGEPVFAAFDFLRAHWTERDDSGELTGLKARWLDRVRECWPLTDHTTLAAELADSATEIPFGHRTVLDNGRLTVFPHGTARTTGEGTPWALDLLWTFLGGAAHGGHPDRWTELRDARAAGRAAGFALLRAGRHDLGGVLWARAEQP